MNLRYGKLLNKESKQKEEYIMNTVKVRNIEIGAGIPKVCVPIVGVKREEILAAGEQIKKIGADVVEWRVDWYDHVFNFLQVEETAKNLRGVLGDIPILFTFRTSREGGKKTISANTYVNLNKAIVKTGYVDLIDVEAFMGDEIVIQLIAAAHDYGVKVVASNHDFHKTPDQAELVSRLRKMQDLGADIPKIAVMPRNKKDVLVLLAATEEMYSSYADRPIITISMAGSGVISRLCGEVFGSALTFGSAGNVSAPGQMEVKDLKTILALLHRNL